MVPRDQEFQFCVFPEQVQLLIKLTFLKRAYEFGIKVQEGAPLMHTEALWGTFELPWVLAYQCPAHFSSLSFSLLTRDLRLETPCAL